MSLKDIELKLKTLGVKNDVAALEAFVSSLEDEKVIMKLSIMTCVITLFALSVVKYTLV